MNESIQQTSPLAVAVTAQNIELSATSPDEIGQAQQALIHWAKAKIAELRSDHCELISAYQKAVEGKWAADTLKRQAHKCWLRVEFYCKVLTALEHGFVIIPNFPVTVFAIRTDRKKPLKMLTTDWHGTHEQRPAVLPQQQGEYQNPFPTVYQKKYTNPNPSQGEPKEWTEYFCEEWKELEFPITMAKSNIIEATSRAMALKLFDDFGIMPERKLEDPIIVARLLDPRSSKYHRRFITFMVAWHLNTRDL